MKTKRPLVYYISFFVVAQVAWMCLLGLWIYFYVSNYIIIEQVGDQLAPQITIDTPNALVFSGGIVLIIAIAVGMSLQFLESMLQDSKRLQNLIDSILEISALEQKRVAHNFQIYKSGEIFRKLLIDSKTQFKISDDHFVINGNPDVNCVIDISAIRIVFDNLIDNAVKYSVNKVSIETELKTLGNKIILTFKDNGIGIPSEEQKLIFKKFHRIYRKDIPSVKGTGLGLYMVKGIIKVHGGKIFVKSDGIDKGSLFLIELPIYKGKNQKYLSSLLTRK